MKHGLVPTLRTDKNGRTQIRHVRPEHAASGRPIPAPPAPGSAPSRIDDLIGLIYDATPETLWERYEASAVPHARLALEAAEQEDPELVPLAIRLTSTGAQTGRALAAEMLLGIFDRVGRAVRIARRTGGDDATPAAIAEEMLGPDLHNELSIAWAAGNMFAEFGWEAALNDPGMLRATSDMRWVARKLRKATGAPEDQSGPEWDTHWRGVAALTEISAILTEAADGEPETARQVAEIVRLAGGHPDIPALKATVRQRGANRDPAEALALLRELSEHPTALADGAL